MKETFLPYPLKDDNRVSHGICDLCLPKANAEVDAFINNTKKNKQEKK